MKKKDTLIRGRQEENLKENSIIGRSLLQSLPPARTTHHQKQIMHTIQNAMTTASITIPSTTSRAMVAKISRSLACLKEYRLKHISVASKSTTNAPFRKGRVTIVRTQSGLRQRNRSKTQLNDCAVHILDASSPFHANGSFNVMKMESIIPKLLSPAQFTGVNGWTSRFPEPTNSWST